MVREAVKLSARDVCALSQLFRWLPSGIFAIVFLLLVPGTISAQEKNPFAGDAKAAKLGESQFRINCAFCHGLGARGGGRGPDLTRTQKKHGSTDEELYHTINEGVPGTAMPANGTTGQGVGMTAEEVWEVITYIRSVEKRTTVTGNAGKGDALFHGTAGCATCHMVSGKGGRLGPELSLIGEARSVDSLVESVRNPNRRLAWGLIEGTKEFPQEYLSVSVETTDGQKFSGVVLNEDNFSLQMMDMRERMHMFEKDKLKTCEISRGSRMPAYDSKTLSDSELQDIIAYLVSVSAK